LKPEDLRRLQVDDWRLYRELRLASLADAPYAFGARIEAMKQFDESEWRQRLANRRHR